MARKPAPLELIGGKGPRQRVWDMLRRTKGKPFERLEAIPCGVDNDTARTYLTSLERGGYIALVGERLGVHRAVRVRRYRLVRDVGAEAPRVKRDGSPVLQGLAQEQMWRTLRMLKGDTNARELAAHAGTREVPVIVTAAADYLRNLHHAAYLECTATARRGQIARYRLVNDTGPRPPMVCRARCLYDPNLGKTVWIAPVTEEDAIYGI